MGVPSFFRWLARKYPKILVNAVEEYPRRLDNGTEVPVDTSRPNPNNMEFDCLYLDMNGAHIFARVHAITGPAHCSACSLHPPPPRPSPALRRVAHLTFTGIIHPCAHPENKDPPKNEAEMMLAIMAYIDRLFGIARSSSGIIILAIMP